MKANKNAIMDAQIDHGIAGISRHYRMSRYTPPHAPYLQRSNTIQRIATAITSVCGTDFIIDDDTVIVPTNEVTQVLSAIIDLHKVSVIGVDRQVTELRLVA